MNWSEYRLRTEVVREEDGGGYRLYYPTLGYAVLGVGDTKKEALESLVESQHLFQEFLTEHKDYSPPSPSRDDKAEAMSRMESVHASCMDVFAFAA
jgi:predicted RNase H-like HicB family nuclease